MKRRTRLLPTLETLLIAAAVLGGVKCAKARRSQKYDKSSETWPQWMHNLREVSQKHAGAFKWQNSKFNQHNGKLERANDFLAWLLGRRNEPSEADTMNCHQCVLYLHHQAGFLSKERLQSIYGVDGPGGMRDIDRFDNLYKGMGVPRAREISIDDALEGFLFPPGTFVFFNKTKHVAMAIGEGEYVSLWHTPNEKDSLQVLALEELLGLEAWDSVKVLENPFGLNDDL